MYTGHSETQFLQVRAEHYRVVITAVFNLDNVPRTKLVSLSYCEPSLAGDEAGYLFRVHSSGKLLRHADGSLAIMELHFGPHDCHIITRYPVRRFQQTDVAVLGLLGKMAGAAAVMATTYKVLPETSEIQADLELKALGNLGEKWIRPLKLQKADPN